MAIAALILGIVGLILSFVPCLGMYALPITILAIILGGLGMKKIPGKGMAIGGLVTGVLGTLVAAFWLYSYLTVKNAVNDGSLDRAIDKQLKEAQDEANRQMKEAGSGLGSATPDTAPPAAPAGSAAAH